MGHEFEWMNELDERQQKEVTLARVYATSFAHGTDGHNRLLLIAKLTDMLNKAEQDRKANGNQLRESTG